MGYRFVCLAIAALAASTATAAPKLPVPDGKYAVGVTRTEFVDASRRLDARDPASGPRRMPAVVWYPTGDAPSADGAAYMDHDEISVTLPALARNLGYTDGELQPVAAARVPVRLDAASARGAHGFPVVVFNHGFFLYPEQNSVLATRLASHGYIVVSITHPGDSADVRLADGRVVATNLSVAGDDPRFAKAMQNLVTGTGLSVTRKALADYDASFASTRMGRSFAEWRDDTLAVAHAIVTGNEPAALHGVLATADRKRLAFVGMSFGGATAATSCRLVESCRAAVNLDGQNFDPGLFDKPVGRPLLLMLSDWTRYSLFKDQWRGADFSPNDLAYESWKHAGENSEVVRVRLQGSRHMGFTDMVTLLNGPKREGHVGDIKGDVALSAVGDVVLAFLDTYVRGDKPADIDRAIRQHPELERHVPERLRRWVSEADRAR